MTCKIKAKAGRDPYNKGKPADEEKALRLQHVYSEKKLLLVLDLDHTLLNSVPFARLDAAEASRVLSLVNNVRRSGRSATSVLDIHAFLKHPRILTKLRPFVHDFLCQASTMFKMYVYTMGTRAYAKAMVHLLDPSRRFFGDRIISRDDNCSMSKSLELIHAPASATLILDDSHHVWPDFLANLIQIDPYNFFDSTSKHVSIHGPSLLGSLRDESLTTGTLARTLNLLHRAHRAFFNNNAHQCSAGNGTISAAAGAENIRDVRQILHGLRCNLLMGCKIVFSSVFPKDASYDPRTQPLWCLAEQLGAVCSTALDDSITHVVTYHTGTKKAKWARDHGRHLVHPRWIEATYFTWERAAESNYTVYALPNAENVASTFSTTTNLLQEVPMNASCRTNLLDVSATVLLQQQRRYVNLWVQAQSS